MILTLREDDSYDRPCPHTRGDDPRNRAVFKVRKDLSPYAWG